MCAAHVYLNGLDHHLARQIKRPAIRYMDDIFIFGDGRAELRAARAEVARWLDAERGLRLKHPQARILSTQGHLDGLGHRIRRERIAPLPRLMRRIEGLARDAALCGITVDEFERRFAATLGGVVWA